MGKGDDVFTEKLKRWKRSELTLLQKIKLAVGLWRMAREAREVINERDNERSRMSDDRLLDQK